MTSDRVPARESCQDEPYTSHDLLGIHPQNERIRNALAKRPAVSPVNGYERKGSLHRALLAFTIGRISEVGSEGEG